MHRLDVGTTGVMVVALSERAYSVLKDAFRDRTVEKIYHAVVQGHPDPSEGTIDAPIGRHPSSDWKFAVVAGGRDSITHYETIEAFPSASLLEIHLETGRTHQIRVHFAAMRHPCVGDRTYGADPDPGGQAGTDPAVAARPLAGVRAPRGRPLGRVHQPVSGGPGSRPRGPRSGLRRFSVARGFGDVQHGESCAQPDDGIWVGEVKSDQRLDPLQTLSDGVLVHVQRRAGG